MIRIEKHRSRGVEAPEINVVPMIDVMVFLLIFFLMGSTLVQETGVQVHRPVAATGGNLENTSILIAVAANGSIHMDNREVGLLSLRAMVKEQLRLRDLPVIIVADRDSRTRAVVEVMDECRLAGAKTVNLATEKK